MRIAISPPEFVQFRSAMLGGPADATHIIQRYVARGLESRGHELTFVAPLSFDHVTCTRDVSDQRIGRAGWSASPWFDSVARNTWRVQRRVGVPYLNVFSNYRLYDTCLHCLPGHDVVYERNTLYRTGVARACRRLGIPYVLYIEADDIFEHDLMGTPITGVLRWRARRTAKFNLDAADCVITVSEPTRDRLASHWSVPREKILVFPNAVDVQRFRPDHTARSEVRRTLGVSDAPVVMFLGNFYEWHDVSTLLRAVAVSLGTYPALRCVLVGDGGKRKAMEQLAADLGIGHAVSFIGLIPHADVPRMLSAADIAVVPYPVMPQGLWLSPLKLYEYMASGAAIIASSLGQIEEVITDHQNGLLTPPGDIAAMAAAIERLIENRSLRLRLATRAREDAVQKHSWEQYLARLEELLASAAASSSAKGSRADAIAPAVPPARAQHGPR